jgi:acyl dehydratase
MEHPPPPLLGQGLPWQRLKPGACWRSHGRTVTEWDLMAFVTLAGMQEPLFLDATEEGALGARPVPGALTYALAEGMVLKLVTGRGLAMLESTLHPRAPVRVGDTISAECRVAEVVPTSRGNRAVVTFAVAVRNQHGATVMDYTVKRLMAGEEEA